MQAFVHFADSTVKQVKNDLYFLSFRAIVVFFCLLLVSLKALSGEELFHEASLMKLEQLDCTQPHQFCGCSYSTL